MKRFVNGKSEGGGLQPNVRLDWPTEKQAQALKRGLGQRALAHAAAVAATQWEIFFPSRPFASLCHFLSLVLERTSRGTWSCCNH